MTKKIQKIEDKLRKDAELFNKKIVANNDLEVINAKIIAAINSQNIYSQKNSHNSRGTFRWLIPSGLVAAAVLLMVNINIHEQQKLKYNPNNNLVLMLDKKINPTQLSLSIENKLTTKYIQEQVALNKDLIQIKNLFFL